MELKDVKIRIKCKGILSKKKKKKKKKKKICIKNKKKIKSNLILKKKKKKKKKKNLFLQNYKIHWCPSNMQPTNSSC